MLFSPLTRYNFENFLHVPPNHAWSSYLSNFIPSPPPPPPARAKYRRAVYFMYPQQSYALKYKLYYKGKSNVTFNLRSRREIDIS